MELSMNETASEGLKSERSVLSEEHNERLDNMNLLIVAAQCVAWVGCLIFVSQSEVLWANALVLLFFCLMMQGVFSMMHEGFHEHAHRNPIINSVMCWLSSTLFGASATFIKINHQGHHVRNRTSAELVDYVEEHESRIWKTVNYYLAIFGGIWLGALLASVLFTLMPSRWLLWLKNRGESNTYAAALADFAPEDIRQIRIEVIGAALFWALAFYCLPFNWNVVALSYVAFAFSWSSLQWVYHVRTPLDVVEGTYNLRAPKLIRWLLLNFNYNLTHHRNPEMRWQLMHSSSNLEETRPLWLNWLQIFRPPQPMPVDRQIPKIYT